MTVEVTSYFSGPYIANGATTVFPFSFISMDADELGVLLRDADGVDTVVSTSLYSVTRAADGTGSVVFSTAPASGSDLYIFSDVSFAQSVEFEDGSGWKAAPVNSVADRSAARDIWLKGRVDRSLIAPIGESLSALPSVDNRLGKFLAFDAAGNPVAADGTGPDSGLRSDLAALGGSALVGYRAPGVGAEARPAEDKLGEMPSVTDYMGVLSVTAAIQAAITAAVDTLYFPNGTYTISSQINLKSNLTIIGAPGAKIVQAAGVSGYMLRLSGLTNVTIRDLAIEGNGEASGDSSVYLSGCSDVLIDNVTVTKSRSIGIWCVSSSNVNVTNSNLSSNYAYGLEFRDSDGCRAIGNLCANNGETGIASSTGGRGIMLWRSRGCYIAGNRLITNTEYGFRLYSEAADATTSYGNVITGNIMLDNTRTDFVIYDEGASFSFVARNTISDNIAYRTTNTTLGQVYLLHGDYNTYTNNQAYKIGAFGTDVGFNFFNANYCTLIGSTAQNMAQGVSTSSSANIVIDNFLGDTVAQGVTNPTTGIVVKNSNFIHGGGGGSDVCISNIAATGKNFYEGNRISGFNTGIYSNGEAVAIYRNTTTSCTIGFRLDGTSLANLECGQNSWDTASNSELFGLTKTLNGITVGIGSILPATFNFPRGSHFYLSAPSVGAPYHYVKHNTGQTDWTSVGNL